MLLLALTEEDLRDDLEVVVRLHRKKVLRAVGRLRALQDEYLEKQSKKKVREGTPHPVLKHVFLVTNNVFTNKYVLGVVIMIVFCC